MTPSLLELPQFREEVRRLSRKYPHIEEDLRRSCQRLLDNPTQGAYAIPGYERKLWKVRLPSTDQRRGKSGGFRLIFYFDGSRPEAIHALTIYPKSEREDLSPAQLWDLYQKFLRYVRDYERKPP